mmetsp:Transcript_19801/g.33301  ORF Transcript_19801/g.33301 Transcript_19801/m.33301 type:complete len:396 (+) Transcript_19801:49-1236(+)
MSELREIIPSVDENDASSDQRLSINLPVRKSCCDKLDVALISLAQHSTNYAEKIQVTAPARFLYERTIQFMKLPPTEEEYVADIKACRNHVRESEGETFCKDSPEALELNNANKICEREGTEVDAWRRDYKANIPRVNEQFNNILGDFADSDEVGRRRDLIKNYTRDALSAFLCTTKPKDTFDKIKYLNGNPSVIAIYGHGGRDNLVAADGGYEHIYGNDFAEQLFDSGLRPKVVLFVSCYGYAVATAAHQHWLSKANELTIDESCIFIGPCAGTPGRGIFDGNEIPARFLYIYFYSSLGLEIHRESHGEFSVPFKFTTGKDSVDITWTRRADEILSPAKFLALFKVCLFDNYDLNLLYFDGAVIDSDTAISERKEMKKDSSHLGWGELRNILSD